MHKISLSDNCGYAVCLLACQRRPWKGEAEALPLSIEALEGFSQPAPAGRKKVFYALTRMNEDTAELPADLTAPWLVTEPPLVKAFALCRRRLQFDTGEQDALPVMHAKVISVGYNFIHVPTHFFKIILGIRPKAQAAPHGINQTQARMQDQAQAKRDSGPLATLSPAAFGSFLVPNQPMGPVVSIDRLRVPLTFLESVSGMDFSVSGADACRTQITGKKANE